MGQISYRQEKGRGGGEIRYYPGLSVLELTLYEPPGLSERRLARRLEKLEQTFRKAEVSRVILPRDFPYTHRLRRLRPVEPLAFYRAVADLLVLEWMALRGIPPERGRVALAAGRLCPELEQTARRLCPRVRAVRVDVPGEEGTLFARCLQREFGLPVTPPAQPVDVTLSFGGAAGDLNLWGENPDLGGLTLKAEGLDLPEEIAPQMMSLLWERGSLRRESIQVLNLPENAVKPLPI